ncbi:MAG TPA: sugar phosphate isomerase/epimerase family protein [Candidatus Sphingobacterium stercoripullorum]|uniref:Sugar phosphate isomerase/epimerase n=1 Tax=Candidatus Sphingobacterium stercoripullorum TaxID=2838759 RepID=A0A9D2AYI6_9SPHI|nr:sugar phosphate isomerase/epimerase [Candidatus Sphingobacterium stercoripullorum]HLR50740.1 sugar phosphate isomerase/epimerase family protein [Candidatus Sphingobacterium stercoripullorum]
MMDRRGFIIKSALFGGALWAAKGNLFAAEAFQKSRYKVAVIDLMILKRQKLGAVKLTHEIGADGLEVDMGGLGDRDTFDNQFFDKEFLKNYKSQLKEYGVQVCSVAMTGFYAQSFAKRPTYKLMLADTLKTCKLLDVDHVFLPLGVQGDLVKNPELRPALVKRLRIAGKMAKKKGITIGIETALDAKGDRELLKEIGSDAIKIYFNFSNPLKEGRDLIQEIEILGAENISMIHCTDEDGVWLENNTRLDMVAVKKKLDELNWSGWLVIERSRDASISPRNVKENFGANTRYVKSIFQ